MRDQWPSSSQRKPCWCTSQAAEYAAVPTCSLGDPCGLERRGDDDQPLVAHLERGGVPRRAWWSCPRRPRPRRPAVRWCRRARRRPAADRGRAARRRWSRRSCGAHRACSARVTSRSDAGRPRRRALRARSRPRTCVGDVVAVQQRHASFHGAGGEVLGQLASHRAGRDDVDGGDDAFDLAADVGGVPARAARADPGERDVDDGVAVDPADRGRAPSSTPAAGGVKPRACSSSTHRCARSRAVRRARPCRGGRRTRRGGPSRAAASARAPRQGGHVASSAS